MITLSNTSIDTSRIGWTRNNKIWYKIQGDTVFGALDSYQVLLEVSFFGDSVAFSQRQSPDTNGEFFFEVNQILEDLIQEKFFANDIQLPTLNQSTPRITEQPFSFVLKFTEYKDAVAFSTIERTIKAISAGLDYDDFTHQTQREWLFTKHKFFTSTSDPKPAMPDVEDYLYFYNTYSYQFFDIWVELRYKDNTVNSYIAYPNFDSQKKTIIIPTGYNELQIEANRDTSKLLYEWRVWVTKHNDATLRISEPVNYRLDEQYLLEKRKFLFGNSLGGYETFYCKANLADTITSRKTVNKRLYGQDYRLRDGENFVGSQDGKRRFEAATGWLSTEFADALQDAAISNEFWEITPKGFIPVIIELISAVYYEKNNELIGYVFQGSYAYDVDLYTKDIDRKANGLPDFQPEPTYTVSISVHYRGYEPNSFKPVIELNEKIEAFTIFDTFGLATNMQYKYSEAAIPNFDVLPLVSYAALLALIANGSGNYKIQLNPTILIGFSEATFRFEYEKFGDAPASTWSYNFAQTNSIYVLAGFENQFTITSVVGQADMYFKIKTDVNVSYNTITATNYAGFLVNLAALPINTPFEIMFIKFTKTVFTLAYTY